MDTNVQALKGLYVALNGDPKDVENMTTSSEVITALNDVAAAAATELPVVKKVDEGKVLTVNGNGKWAAKLPESVIDDEEASESKTYSSSKIASLIPADELPAVTTADNSKLLGVSSGAWSALVQKSIIPSDKATNSGSNAIMILQSGEYINANFFALNISGDFYYRQRNSGSKSEWVHFGFGVNSSEMRYFTLNDTDAQMSIISLTTISIENPATT